MSSHSTALCRFPVVVREDLCLAGAQVHELDVHLEPLDGLHHDVTLLALHRERVHLDGGHNAGGMGGHNAGRMRGQICPRDLKIDIYFSHSLMASVLSDTTFISLYIVYDKL